MANGDYLGGYAVKIPSFFGTPGEVLKAATAQEERSGEKALEIARQQRELEQKQQAENFKNLLESTEFKKYDTPDIELNKVTQKELNKIFNEGKSLLSKSPIEFQTWLATRPKDFNDWYRVAKSDLGNVAAQRQEFNKDFPNVNLTKANNLVSKNFLDNYTELDPNTGERLIKPAHLINPQNDYYSQLKTPEVLGEITEYTQPATDLFAKIKTENVGDKQYTNKRGQVTTRKWSGVITPFTQMDEDEKGNPIAVTKYDTMNVTNPKTGKMEEMKLATPELIQYVTQSSPGATASMFKLWSDEKKAKGLGALDPAVEEPLFKNFIYRYADRNLPHQIKTEEGTVTPRITVNAGGSTTPGIRDVYSEMTDLVGSKSGTGYTSTGIKVSNATPVNELSSTAQVILIDYVNKLKGRQEEAVSQADIVLANDKNGKLGVYDFDVSTNKIGGLIAPIDYSSINIKAQPTAAGKAQAIIPPSKPETKYVINGQTFTYKELINSGKWTDADIKKLSKQ